MNYELCNRDFLALLAKNYELFRIFASKIPIPMLQIRCKNNNVTKSFPEGTSLLDVYQEFADEIKLPYPVVSAKVNNASEGLKFRLFQNRDVEFLDAREGSGHRVYVRSLCFLLYKATQDIFPGSKLFIEHTISRGYYCNFKKKNNEALAEGDVERISQRMMEIVGLDMPFRRNEATNEEAIRVFAERGFYDKVKLLETSGQIYSDYYTLGDTADYYYGPLVPSAGYLKVFGLEPYHDGMLLRVPDWNDPTRLAEKVDMPKTYEMFREKTRWDIIMRLSNAGDVNKAILKGHASELIQVSEALQEKRIVQIAEEIDRRFHAEENPIRPEKMVDIEASYRYSGSSFSASAGVYLMEYQDILLETGRLSSSGYAIKENVPRGWRRGIELASAWTPMRWIRLDANMTLSTNRLKDYTSYVEVSDGAEHETHPVNYGETDMLLSPSVIGMAKLTFFPIKRTTLSIDGKYVGRQFIDNTMRKEMEIPAYFVANITASYDIPLPKGILTLTGYVNNIFNNMYYAYGWRWESYSKATGEIYSGIGVYPQAPCNALLKLSYRF